MTGLLLTAALVVTPAVDAAEETQDLVFLAESGPVLVRLHVRVDGKPFRPLYRAAWEDYVRHVFRYLDRGGKGYLTEAEARRLPPPLRSGAAVGPGGMPINVAFNFRVLDADGDGKVTLRELLEYYEEFGGGALRGHVDTGQRRTSTVLGEALFTRLDANKDGKLDADELKAAATTLFRLDYNQDELVTAQELAPAQFPAVVMVAPGARMAPMSRPPEPPFLIVGTDDNLGERIRRHYAPPGTDSGLGRKSLGIDAATFVRLDTNKDGKLDAAELDHFAARPADVDLMVRLGETAPGEAPLQVLPAPGRKAPPFAVRTSAAGTVTLAFGKTLVEFSCNPARPRVVDGTNDTLLQRFRADAGEKGHLTVADARRTGLPPTLFSLLDRDGDGKLTEKELRAYLVDIQARQARALGHVASLRISAEGSGLFDLLDANRDGRLGLREARAAAGVLGVLERAGGVTREDLPRTFRVALGLGRARFDRVNDDVLSPPGLPLLRLHWSRPGLVWFHKMDRNHDGDVSPREFLGTAEQFRRLDADHDGLISLEEAERADSLFRKKKP